MVRNTYSLPTHAPAHPPGRRRLQKAYNDLSSAEAGSYRTGEKTDLRKYLRVWARHLPVLCEEGLHEDRMKVRWCAFRGRQQALQRVADKLLGRTSCDRRKLMRLVRGGAAPQALDLCDDAAIDAQIAKWRAEAARLAPDPGTRRLVVWGDGDFPAGYRKNQAVPRKAILRKLMHHGCVILLDEYKTSKTCPACGCDLDDAGNRLRVCPSGSCELFKDHPKGMDRDVLACLNMVRCVYELLTKGTRLEWLQRDDDDGAPADLDDMIADES